MSLTAVVAIGLLLGILACFRESSPLVKGGAVVAALLIIGLVAFAEFGETPPEEEPKFPSEWIGLSEKEKRSYCEEFSREAQRNGNNTKPLKPGEYYDAIDWYYENVDRIHARSWVASGASTYLEKARAMDKMR